MIADAVLLPMPIVQERAHLRVSVIGGKPTGVADVEKAEAWPVWTGIVGVECGGHGVTIIGMTIPCRGSTSESAPDTQSPAKL